MPKPSSKRGSVYLIGAGPGDPGLITVKGRECIARADVILYDHLANDTLLRYARPDAELIYSGKVGGQHNREQRQINELLIAKAGEGKIVARLKGGDPFIFGRGGEECEALVEAGIPFEVVPGVTAGIGATAYAGIPLTHRDVTTSVAFVTGHERPGREESAIDWEKLSLGSGTVVFYMGVKNLPIIARNLIAHGRSPNTPVALIRWGTRPDQQVLTGTLGEIPEKARACGFSAPAVTVVGEVVALRERLRWFDNRSLSGRKIVVTRAADQAGELSALLSAKGAEVFECPTIAIEPPGEWGELDAAVAELSSFDWVVFSSANAVRFFFMRLAALGFDSRAFGRAKVCAVGPRTAEELIPHGIRADLIPPDYKGEGVVTAFTSLGVAGASVLFPRGDKAREVVPAGLTRLGARVVSPVTYRNVRPETIPDPVKESFERGEVDCVTFTSSSTVENLAALLGENRLIGLLERVTVASIGPITSATCRELGLRVAVEPESFTVPALVEAVERHFRQCSGAGQAGGGRKC